MLGSPYSAQSITPLGREKNKVEGRVEKGMKGKDRDIIGERGKRERGSRDREMRKTG